MASDRVGGELDDGRYDDHPWDDVDDDDFDMMNCAMGADGQCGHAGTEWCDWDCPLSRAHVRRRTSA